MAQTHNHYGSNTLTITLSLSLYHYDTIRYVYDVYYSEGGGEGEAAGGDFDDSLLDGLFSIQVQGTEHPDGGKKKKIGDVATEL